MGISAYSTTPGANTAISGINIGENCNASNINDAIRQMMADIASALSGGQLLPTGSVVAIAAAATPAGFLYCDGSAVSRTTYAALWGVLGSTWGSGDGSTTFNLPDLRSRTVVGAGTAAGAGLTARALAGLGGEENHTLLVAEVPALAVNIITTEDGSYTHTLVDPAHSHTYADRVAGVNHANTAGFATGADELLAAHNASTLSTTTSTTGITIDALPQHNHTVAGNTSGGGGLHNNMQPFAPLNYVIKT